MDVHIAEGLFDDMVSNGIGFETLIMFWLGEPLLHPEFTRIWSSAIRAAVRGCFDKVEVHSNATHLNQRARAALLN